MSCSLLGEYGSGIYQRFCMKNSIFFLMLSVGVVAFSRTKYPVDVEPLSISREYVQRNPAPDFWRLIPFYVGQRDSVSCSLATATTLVNGMRDPGTRSSDERLWTQDSLFAKVNSPIWKRGLDLKNGDGVSILELKDLLLSSFTAAGLKNWDIKVFQGAKIGKGFSDSFRRLLNQNEKSSENFIVVNFDQGYVTGDDVAGHFSPIAAFDPTLQRVLILDVDREWFEPYWVPVEKLIGAMTKDPKQDRGFLWISRK